MILELYSTFPIDGNLVVEESDQKTISRFFSPELTSLLKKEDDCREQTTGVGNLEFKILSHSQDDLKGFKILQATNNIVRIKFDTPDHGEFIDFIIQDNKKCKLIKDIKYNDTNLLKILSQ